MRNDCSLRKIWGISLHWAERERKPGSHCSVSSCWPKPSGKSPGPQVRGSWQVPISRLISLSFLLIHCEFLSSEMLIGRLPRQPLINPASKVSPGSVGRQESIRDRVRNHQVSTSEKEH